MSDVIYRQDVLNLIPQDISDFEEGSCLAYDVGRLPSAQQWIPCSKRLPEIGQTVITSSDLGRVREATYKGFDAWTIHGVVHWTDEILSWMPMPDPYKEDN